MATGILGPHRLHIVSTKPNRLGSALNLTVSTTSPSWDLYRCFLKQPIGAISIIAAFAAAYVIYIKIKQTRI